MVDSAIKTQPWPGHLPGQAKPARSVIDTLSAAGFEAYLVGGAVRDLVLGVEPGDFDVATSAPPEAVMSLFAKTEAVGASFGVVLAMVEGVAVETATFRTDDSYSDGRHPDGVSLPSTLAEDAARRDFTVNALYLDPGQGLILDPVGGLADCANRLLRAVGEPASRFREDGLRLLRAPRLAAQCGLTLAPATGRALGENAGLISQVSAERIGKEIGLLLTGPAPAKGLELMAESGLLRVLLPEVDALRGVPQPPEFHPEGDVWSHTLLMFEASPRRSLSLGLAILLHDVGKPATIRYADRIRFDGHCRVGAELTEVIGRRLRLPIQVVRRAADLVDQHMRFIDVQKMRPATLKRFLRQDLIHEALELHRADCVASHGMMDNYEFCRAALDDLEEEELQPPPLLKGGDLLALGYPSGPLIGKLLRELETAQLEGDLTTRAEAEAWLRRNHPPPGGNDPGTA